MKKAQSILEYTLLLGVVIGVVVAVLMGPMQTKINTVYTNTGGALDKVGSQLNQGIFK
jgi:Flp pilus assembly pilin Flp